MMLFKLSLKNIRKSFKDYTIYFLTLILGVAIFYVFNSLDSQTAMMNVSNSTREIMKLMVTMLSGVSVCVALILGFLIIYANNFLIKRRKKEFAVYMTLGMGKKQVSRILLGETILIGILSLGVGLGIGIFASQFMSILVSRMFEADLSAYVFVFSKGATIKTIIYFSIMYIVVVMFNAVTLSRYKLIDLFQAAKKTEKGQLKSSVLAVFVFIMAVAILGYAYYQVSVNTTKLTEADMLEMIALGCVGTFMVFWSMSGFLLNLLKKWKGFYLKGVNSFVLRQVNSNINTAVFSMTVICLLFFVTICVLSSGLALNAAFTKDLQRMCPRDINLYKTMDISGDGYSEEAIADSKLTVVEALEKCGVDLSLIAPGDVEISTYADPKITFETSLGAYKEAVLEQFPMIRWETCETIVGISEYNEIATYYGQPTYELAEDEYIVLCTFNKMKEIRNKVLSDKPDLQLGNAILKSKYAQCKDGFLHMNMSSMNQGVIVVPDSVIESQAGVNLTREQNIWVADYVAETKAGKAETEDKILGCSTEALHVDLDGMSKIAIYESAVGLSAIVTFIAIYLGIVFLIAGAALLALKELSESTDNKERYAILNKIGVDANMQRRALLSQMGIFFGMPMALAIIHSIFGIKFAGNFLALYSEFDSIISILATAGILLVVYGGYFMATYFGCKRIIEE